MSRALAALGLACGILPSCSNPCFVASDATPGWKRVALPPAEPSQSLEPAIALAAPEGVDQFRAGEPALVWDADQPGPPPSRPGFGLVEYRLPAAGARLVEVEFAAGLDGARVDVDGETPAGRVPLIAGRRVNERRLRVEWERDDVRALVVTIHRHLRPLPIATRFRSGTVRVVDAAEPRAFARPALYYRQPRGAPVELCPAPARRLSVARAALPSRPSEVAAAALDRAPGGLYARARRLTAR